MSAIRSLLDLTRNRFRKLAVPSDDIVPPLPHHDGGHLQAGCERQDFYVSASQLARDARLLVTIPLWYRPSRLAYLADMVRVLSEFVVRQLDMIILTQTSNDDEINVIRRLVAPYESVSKTFRVVSATELTDQFSLCWEHRKIIKEVFLASDAYSHFIYLEDDIRFSFLNFCYFLAFRNGLEESGLIPSFVRVEYNAERIGYFATDQMGFSTNNRARDVLDKESETMMPEPRRHIISGNQMFVQMDNPYCAVYVLDRRLAVEFAASRSFDRINSESLTHWGVSERAAMGLCFESAPEGWTSRYVIPVDPRKLIPDHYAWVYHLPNNFTSQKDQPWGQRSMDEIFATGIAS
jgi:hypothetical protein